MILPFEGMCFKLNRYRTFYEQGESEVIQKKSRFIGQTFYASTEEAVQEILAGLRKQYKMASSYCYAYRMEGPTVTERQSDDGEPGGTAGMPILDVLRGEEIVNGLVAVVRYYGGTPLGTGGLVKAYGSTAREAVDASKIITKERYRQISILSDYALSGKIEYELKTRDIPMAETSYTDKVTFHVYISLEETAAFCDSITDLTASMAVIEQGGEVYGGVLDGKFRLL